MKIIFKNEQFSFQTLRLLTGVPAGQADINEVIETAQRITGGDLDSWREEWAKTGDRLLAHAHEFERQGHAASAAESYLRASSYYRAAVFYTGLSLYDGCGEEVKERLEELEDKALDCFRRSMELSGEAEPVAIPYEGTTLPGYFYRADQPDGKPAPTLLLIEGYDGTKEELYAYALYANKRGMHCLTMEGPGQGEVIRKMHLPFRPDYEKVITPAVDFLIRQSQVDAKRIVLWGESFGGYLAPRAAAFEHRLAACVANSGVYDFMGPRIGKNIDREADFQKFASMPEFLLKIGMNRTMKDPQNRWAIKHGVYVFGAKDPRDYILKTKDCYLGRLASQIQCPTLVTDSDGDANFPGQAKKLYDALTCRKDFIVFSKEDGAEEHCQMGAKLFANARIFDWIESILSNLPE